MNHVKSSNLNYYLEQSPFAAKISLKKSAVKDKSGTPLKLQLQTVESENASLQVMNEELENEVQSLRADLKQMELHRDASAEKNDALELILKKSSDDYLKKCDENKSLKMSLMTLDIDQGKLKQEISNLKKSVKEKNKTIYRLETGRSYIA